VSGKPQQQLDGLLLLLPLLLAKTHSQDCYWLA
jgi:hypothetical protein